jgi:adenosylcobinamide-phosphate synthase
MMVTGQQLFFGALADLVAGDPRWLPHPVSGIGHIAHWQERWWRRHSRLPLRLAGIGAWFGVVAATSAIVYLSLRWLPAPFIQIYWVYSFLALRSLDQHAMAVIRPLRTNDLEAARRAVGYMVGRDTATLDAHEITRATIETVSENASDGVIAPLFWLLIGGPIAMAVYKAVNTLDSMFGYRSERYHDFGWWSARADDWANWLPARITAALFCLIAAIVPGMSASRAIAATLRDAHRQPSPNSGYPEAAAAGGLGVELGGVNYYRGIKSEKSLLGEPVNPLSWQTYTGMRTLLYVSALASILTAIGVLACQ